MNTYLGLCLGSIFLVPFVLMGNKDADLTDLETKKEKIKDFFYDTTTPDKKLSDIRKIFEAHKEKYKGYIGSFGVHHRLYLYNMRDLLEKHNNPDAVAVIKKDLAEDIKILNQYIKNIKEGTFTAYQKRMYPELLASFAQNIIDFLRMKNLLGKSDEDSLKIKKYDSEEKTTKPEPKTPAQPTPATPKSASISPNLPTNDDFVGE